MSIDYIKKGSDLLNIKTPVIFSDGTDTYQKFTEKYITHDKGFFILAPSGSGKTYFIDRQVEKNWIDGDEIWMATNAHPDGPWWLESVDVIDEIDQRSDVITMEAKKLGLWIIGASNFWLKPDAVVIPDWETHKQYILSREQNNFDGGATSKNWERLEKSRNWMSRWEKEGVKIFKSVEEAVNYLTK